MFNSVNVKKKLKSNIRISPSRLLLAAIQNPWSVHVTTVGNNRTYWALISIRVPSNLYITAAYICRVSQHVQSASHSNDQYWSNLWLTSRSSGSRSCISMSVILVSSSNRGMATLYMIWSQSLDSGQSSDYSENHESAAINRTYDQICEINRGSQMYLRWV